MSNYESMYKLCTNFVKTKKYVQTMKVCTNS